MRNILVDYLKISHSNLNIKFVKIPIFSGAKSGLGLSLKYASKYIKEPFIFHACDTIINYNFKKIIKYKNDYVVLLKDNLNQ